MSQRGLHKWMEITVDIHQSYSWQNTNHMVRNTKTEIFYEENENKSKGKLNVNKFLISTHKHNDWYDLRRVGRYLKRCGEFSDPLKLFFLSVFTKSCSDLKHLVLPLFGPPRRDEPSLLFSVNHTPINLLLPLNDTNYWHQHGGVTTNCYHGPLQYHP